MGKKGKWLSAIKKAFSPSKSDTADKSSINSSKLQVSTIRLEKQTTESTATDEQKKPTREKKRWSFGRSSSSSTLSFSSSQQLPNSLPSKASTTATENHHYHHAGATRYSIGHDVSEGVKPRGSGLVGRQLEEVEEEEGGRLSAQQRKSKNASLAVAVATAAAAEAAVAAAQVAAQVLHLTGRGGEAVSTAAAAAAATTTTTTTLATPRTSSSLHLHLPKFNRDEELASIKIQRFFRGYLARRAVKTLKGLVRLQAMSQGHSVKRQATSTLRCMQALVKLQAQVQARRVRLSSEEEATVAQRQLWLKHRQHSYAPPRQSMDCGVQEGWDPSAQAAEIIQAKMESKQEAAMKRERALAYATSQQHQAWRCVPRLAGGVRDEGEKTSWGWNWLERWMLAGDREDALSATTTTTTTTTNMTTLRRGANDAIIEDPSSMTMAWTETGGRHAGVGVGVGGRRPNSGAGQHPRGRYHSPRSLRAVAAVDEESASTQSLLSAPPRLSCRLSSVASSSAVEDCESLMSLASSSAIPNYMTATQSARAKFRSHSTPKQRPRTPPEGWLPPPPPSTSSVKKRLSFPPMEPGCATATAPTPNPPLPLFPIRRLPPDSSHLQGQPNLAQSQLCHRY